VVAGALPSQAVKPGTAIRIMTGAPIPTGADAVVMIEKTQLIPGQGPLGNVEIIAPARPGQNILSRASAARCGDLVLRAGQRIRAIEVGVLSEVGRTSIQVTPRPQVAILSTGNEIVPPQQKPGGGQIRNSNGPMLAAATRLVGANVVDLGIARDDAAELRSLIARGLQCDVLVLSGGVSAGVLDLVPPVLAKLGVEQVFHKIRLKPGKPLWFGVRDGAKRSLVFGLPGNPVSSLVCFELFVKPAIARLAGQTAPATRRVQAALVIPFKHQGDRPTYHPATLRWTDRGPEVEPLRWQGSADLFTLARANALAHFPAGDYQLVVGEKVETLELPG
jgi:molybdopterin molybdotransferase